MRWLVYGLVAFVLVSARLDAQADSVRSADTTTAVLAPVRVRASIAPIAGRYVGSGIPAQLTTIDSGEIHEMLPRTPADILGNQQGVSLYDDLGSPYKLNLAIRGFGVGPTIGFPAAISVFLDGVRQNEPDAQ